jgi:hypothetical protein
MQQCYRCINFRKGAVVMEKEKKLNGKESYEDPKVLASYKKEELEEIIKPHGTADLGGGGCGQGCGCGCA